jgi:FkbM family methyltransferase
MKQLMKNLVPQSFRDSLHRREWKQRWTPADEAARLLYAQFLPGAGAMVFDVGANVGARTKVFLKIAAKVVAVEPQSLCLARLRALWGHDPRVVLVAAALAETEGTAEINVGNESVLASLSTEWMNRVKESGRFETAQWTRKETVPLTTLDHLIKQHGMPAFIKIDVEGFEYEVMRGLTSPVPAMSFEFTPEYIEATERCLTYLAGLGEIEANHSHGESMVLATKEWISGPALLDRIKAMGTGKEVFGDVYVKFKSARVR